jgi:Uma2 family endonuclease
VNELAQQGGIRLTYYRRRLEIMTPLAPHEKSDKLLENFVKLLTDELNFNICSLGSLTSKCQDLERGLEPDKCYYIQNEAVV